MWVIVARYENRHHAMVKLSNGNYEGLYHRRNREFFSFSPGMPMEEWIRRFKSDLTTAVINNTVEPVWRLKDQSLETHAKIAIEMLTCKES